MKPQIRLKKQLYVNQALTINGVQVMVDELNTDLELLLVRYNRYLARADKASKQNKQVIIRRIS